MKHASLKEELQSVILQSITLAPQTTYNNLNIYKKNFGVDEFFHRASLAFSQQGPLVSLICINCPDSDIDAFLSSQFYSNLEVVRTAPNDSFADIIRYISTAKSKYLCFYEPNQRCCPAKIFDMVYFLEQLSSIDLVIAARSFIDPSGSIIASSELPYSEEQPDTIIDGTLLLQYSINEHKNIFGNLSTLMATTLHAQKAFGGAFSDSFSDSFSDITPSKINVIRSLSFLFHLLIDAKIRIMDTALVSTLLQP